MNRIGVQHRTTHFFMEFEGRVNVGRTWEKMKFNFNLWVFEVQ
jgi:hypothetical protein